MFFFDILLIVVIIYSFYYGFNNGISQPLYELTIIFLGFTFAGSYAYSMGLFLTKYKILLPDSAALMKLIGFLILFLLYWVAVYFIEKSKSLFLKRGLKKSVKFIMGTVNALQVFIITTLIIFLFNQFTVGKSLLRVHLLKSYSYPKIEQVYKRVFTHGFVNNLIKGNMTGTNTHDLFIKTLTDEKVLNSIK